MQLYLNNIDYILTENGIDVSIPIKNGSDNVNAWYCEPVSIEPVVADSFIGDVNQGGAVNFKNIIINPHGNCTHTECVGHISKESYTINQCLKEFHFIAEVLTVQPDSVHNKEHDEQDSVITKESMKGFEIGKKETKALLIRTSENSDLKKTKDYSGSNPTYFSKEAIDLINKSGIHHLMVDLPSVDREVDKSLLSHKTFWNYPDNPELHKTITELIFIPDSVADGTYLATIQIMSIESDASPSKIVLYEINS